MQTKMAKAHKNRASKQPYLSQNQLTMVGFETPFDRSLNSNNRWVILAHKIPWDLLVGTYQSQMGNSKTGADGINPRVAIGSMILKHICNLSDRETVLQIQENMYMQYFIGYSSFSDEEPFDPSLFVEFRKRMGIEQINAINEKILGLCNTEGIDNNINTANKPQDTNTPNEVPVPNRKDEIIETGKISHKGTLIADATACPQDIAYPTDLNLLSDAREKSEELIDVLYNAHNHVAKPRTYRELARLE
jgi:transposase, IS5 family